MRRTIEGVGGVVETRKRKAPPLLVSHSCEVPEAVVQVRAVFKEVSEKNNHLSVG